MSLPGDLENGILRNLLVQTTRAYEEQLRAVQSEKELAQVTLASIGDAVVSTDAAGRIRYMNPTAAELTGWQPAEAIGQTLTDVLQLIDDHSGEDAPIPLARSLAGEPVAPTAGLALVRRDGRRFAISHSLAPIPAAGGGIDGAVLVFRDITERQLLHLQLAHQASHDAMTGLPNRQSFELKLRQALGMVRLGRPQVLSYIDLDQFKLINDTCGHAAGDQLLREVATLLLERLSATDVVARLGGDEFGLLFPDCETDEAMDKVRVLGRALDDLHFRWQGASFRVGASIGVVPIEARFTSVADLLSAADHACYIAKDKGRHRIQLYQPEDAELLRRHDEMQSVVRIEEALREDRFVLWAQPIRRVTEGNGAAFEVLLRLDDGGTLLAPRDFIRAAERYGLMPQIDRWVVRRALATLASHPAVAAGRVGMCSLNLSALSLGDEGFLDVVADELTASGLQPSLVCFEITETAAVSNLDQALRLIRHLRSLGCRFALDDFGSGMSSYGYLRELPVDFLKIDGSFIQDLLSDPLDRAMVESINRIGHLIGIQTVAESVSSAALAAELEAMEVDWLQGYWIGRPRPLDELLAALDGAD